MDKRIFQMLDKYKCQTKTDYKNALKEVIQEVALLGLARNDFFKKGSFYGGSALRIVHGLDRFSEDLDFSLHEQNQDFSFDSYLDGIENELKSFGLNLEVNKKEKKAQSAIESAFIKGDTLEHLLLIRGLEDPRSGINKNDKIKIKIEIDKNPPEYNGIKKEVTLFQPITFNISIYDLPTLFAGKIHALMCRGWRSGRVKGRDLYDFCWYIGKEVSPSIKYLESKMKQTNHLEQDSALTIEKLKKFLNEKFKDINWKQAKEDALPFVKDDLTLQPWSETFFNSLVEKIL